MGRGKGGGGGPRGWRAGGRVRYTVETSPLRYLIFGGGGGLSPEMGGCDQVSAFRMILETVYGSPSESLPQELMSSIREDIYFVGTLIHPVWVFLSS